MAKASPSNAIAPPPRANPKTLINSEGHKPSSEGTPENNTPPLENAPVYTSTPEPKAGIMSGNLFELRKDWLIPPTNNTSTAMNSKLPIKVEPQEQEQPTPRPTAPPKADMVQMGTKLSHFQEYRRRLGWRASKTFPARH